MNDGEALWSSTRMLPLIDQAIKSKRKVLKGRMQANAGQTGMWHAMYDA
jgi:hypothetical protein